jgi:hypothetical protein
MMLATPMVYEPRIELSWLGSRGLATGRRALHGVELEEVSGLISRGQQR